MAYPYEFFGIAQQSSVFDLGSEKVCAKSGFFDLHSVEPTCWTDGTGIPKLA